MENAMTYDEMVAVYNERTGPMRDSRNDYSSWNEVPVGVQSAVIAYDAARRAGGTDAPMSERNALSIAGMIKQAMTATQRGCDDAVDDELRFMRNKLSSLKKLSVYA